jgi:hypothetical protein
VQLICNLSLRTVAYGGISQEPAGGVAEDPAAWPPGEKPFAWPDEDPFDSVYRINPADEDAGVIYSMPTTP